MDFLYQFNDVDFCDSACGEVVIDSNETSDGEKMLCGIVQSTVCGQAIADDQNVELDDCDMDSNSLSGEGLKLGSISPAASNNMTKFHSVVHVQKHELLANFHTVQMDEENTGTGVQQRVIIVAAGNDPQREMNLAIEKITAELDRKASEAMTNGIKPEPETVIEITTVMESSEQHSMQQQKAHTRMLGLGRENIPPAAGTVFVQTNRNLPISREPSVLTVHNKDYKTPSPLVPAWDRRQAEVIDKSCDTDLSCDLYYQPSSAVDNAAASNESMVDGNFVVQGFEAIPVEIEANCVDVANASHASSSTNVVVDRNKSAKIFSQRLEGPRWHPVELVACEEQIDTNMCRRGSPLRRSTSVQQACSSSKVESRRKRPPYSYMQLIQMAIRSTPEMRMTLREIYQWIENQFPYYRHMPSQGWKNSIRHNLSLYDIFVRKKATTGKACVSYWMMRKLDDSDSSFNTTKDMQDLDLSADADVNTGRKRINPPVTSSNERRHCEGTSQQTQRRGLIPLLPKPSPSMSTITVLQLPTNGTGVTSSGDSRRLGASVESTQSSSVSSGWSSQFPTGKLNQALTHSVGPKAMFKRISSATAAEISSTHPVKIKRMCRSASVVENSVSQNLFNVGCQPVSLDPVANVSTFSENQDSELGSSLDTSSLRQQFSDLHFEFSAGDGQKMPVPVRSASDLILSRNISCIVVDSSSAKNVAEIESSKLQATGRTGRRKQTFSNLLRTPPDKMSLKRESKDITPYVDTLNHLEMESGYATMLESGVVISRPETPTHQLIPHSPMHGSAVDEEDVAQMLFTPFKADFNVLALTDLSPVLDMSSSVGAVDSWAGFTPVASEKSSARTSTPCRLLNSTPKISSQDNCRQKYELSPRFYRLLSEFNDEELTGVSQIAADDLDQSGNSNSILDNCIYTENSCINLLID